MATRSTLVIPLWTKLGIIAILVLVSLYLYVKMDDDWSDYSSIHKLLNNEALCNDEITPNSNPLQDVELYLRYTTSGPQFPAQAETWILCSMQLFWPKNSKVVVVLDEEKEADRKYGTTLNETTKSKMLDLRVCYMKPYPPDVIHHFGKIRMYFDMMHADLCSNATYVGLVDVDTLFITAVTPNLIMENGKPVVTGRIGEPRIPCWIQTAEYVLRIKQVMQCMHYFPVTFKTTHIKEFRQYVSKLHGKEFLEVVSEATGKLKINGFCYCHYSMMCNFMWYHHRNEYAWHLQYVKPTQPLLSASVSNEYFQTEVKPEEKIPHPRSSMHVRHFMLNGRYKDPGTPSERFVNDQLLEGLCYSFGIKLCINLCERFNITKIHVNLFNFENYNWLWDSRCLEKQTEHYKNVTKLFDKNYFYLDSREKVCAAIAALK